MVKITSGIWRLLKKENIKKASEKQRLNVF